MFKIRIWLEEGEVAEAKREISRLQISEKDKPTLIREFEYLALVRLLSRQRKFAQAIRLLELLKPQSQRESLLTSIVEISALQALLEYQRGNRSAAWRYLQEAIAIRQANGYIRSFVDEGPAMAQMLGQWSIGIADKGIGDEVVTDISARLSIQWVADTDLHIHLNRLEPKSRPNIPTDWHRTYYYSHCRNIGSRSDWNCSNPPTVRRC